MTLDASTDSRQSNGREATRGAACQTAEVAALLIIPALAMILVGHGVGKLSGATVVVKPLRDSGFPDDYYTPFGIFDLVLAGGLFVGLFITPIGLFCLLILVPYCLLAFVFHFRAGNPQAVPMLVFGALAAYAIYAALNITPTPDRPDEYGDLGQFGNSAS